MPNSREYILDLRFIGLVNIPLNTINTINNLGIAWAGTVLAVEQAKIKDELFQ